MRFATAWRDAPASHRGLVALMLSALLTGCGQPSAPPSDRGARVYALYCQVCHGKHGEGGIAPELTGEHFHKNVPQIVAWIKYALPPMPQLYPAPLSEQEVNDVALFVASL